jgi:hypothetical protein
MSKNIEVKIMYVEKNQNNLEQSKYLRYVYGTLDELLMFTNAIERNAMKMQL